MIVRNVIDALEELAPLSFAMSWDKSGLQLGNMERPVSRLLLTLDLTSESLLLAQRLGSEMIITHHPVIFHPLKKLIDEPPVGNLIYSCIKSDISVASFHTNLDACIGGVSDALCHALDLPVSETFSPLGSEECALQKQLIENEHLKKFIALNDWINPDILPGIGRVSVLDVPIHAKPFVQHLNDRLKTTGCLLNFDKDKLYKKIVVWGGSFDSDEISRLVDIKADCIVAGEIKYHDMISLAEYDIHAISTGHDLSERVILNPLMNFIRFVMPECRVAVYNGLTYDNLIY